jgi:hypothetical protein
VSLASALLEIPADHDSGAPRARKRAPIPAGELSKVLSAR